MLESSLLSFYSNSGPERGGIITRLGPTECKNVSENPEEGYEMSYEDMDKLDNTDTVGTFHTHPGKSANLSYEDYETFMAYPGLKHYIVGKEGVKAYKVVDGRLLNES